MLLGCGRRLHDVLEVRERSEAEALGLDVVRNTFPDAAVEVGAVGTGTVEPAVFDDVGLDLVVPLHAIHAVLAGAVNGGTLLGADCHRSGARTEGIDQVVADAEKAAEDDDDANDASVQFEQNLGQRSLRSR